MFAVLSERGPCDGFHDPTSPSYIAHGSRTAWRGNVAYNDNHVEGMLENTSSPGQEYCPPAIFWGDVSGSRSPDNIFAEDDTITGSDIWLSIFVQSPDDPGDYTALWD